MFYEQAYYIYVCSNRAWSDFMLKGDISYINTTLCIDDDCTLDDLMEKLRAVEELLKEDLSKRYVFDIILCWFIDRLISILTCIFITFFFFVLYCDAVIDLEDWQIFVLKRFDGVPFLGRVNRFEFVDDMKCFLWHVTYPDGDQEHLEHVEMLELIVWRLGYYEHEHGYLRN